MSRCTVCDKFLVVPLGSRVICRPCRRRVERDLLRRQHAIRTALVTLKYGTIPEEHPAALDLLREHLEVLASYEKRNFVTVRPRPSEILAKLPAVVERCTERNRGRGATMPAHPPEPGTPRGKTARWSEQGGPKAEQNSSPQGRQGEDRRRTRRSRVQCMVQLHPGGVRGIARDLSASGAYIFSPFGRPTGTKVRLTIHTSSGTLDREGVVCRREEPRGQGTYVRGEGLAIEFSEARDEGSFAPPPGGSKGLPTAATF